MRLFRSSAGFARARAGTGAALAPVVWLGLAGCGEVSTPQPPADDDAEVDDDVASDDDSSPIDPPCQDGDVRACSSDCGEGVEVCSAGLWGPCDAPAPEPESCDGLDEDCDGSPDDGLLQWRLEPVEHVATPHPTSIALGPGGLPVVAYLDGPVGSEAETVKLARRTGDGWTIEEIATFQEAAPGNATVRVAADPAGAVHVVWARLDYVAPGGGGTEPGGVHYLFSPAPGAPWQAEEILPDGVSGDSLSIDVDGTGGVHICFQRGSSELWYAARLPEGWSTEYVTGGAAFGEHLAGADCSIAVDAAAVPSISYARHSFESEEDMELHLAQWDAGAWNVQVVDTDTPVGAHSSLELDEEGRPRLSYRTYDPLVDTRYAEFDATTWRVEIVESLGNVGGYTSLATAGDGAPHVAYFDWGNERLHHAVRTGGGWVVEVVDYGPGAGRHASLAADPDGGLHVSYVDESRDEIRYAERICCPEGECPPGPWSPTSEDGAPTARRDHTAVWTGDELIVWGGNEGSQAAVLGSGGAWDPGTDAWRPLELEGAPAARDGHGAVWTGAEMIVWGGTDGAAAYGDGALYDPATDTWRPLSSEGAPSARWGHSAVWTGDEMLVWGGLVGDEYLASGGRYDPAFDTWAPMSEGNAPIARGDHAAVWTGTEMIVWGGFDGDVRGDGGRYDAALDRWLPVSGVAAPSARSLMTGVWTGVELVVWGGWEGWDVVDEQVLASGGRYDPAGDAWTPTGTWGAPSARYRHAAAWTGVEMVIWGGRDDRVAESGALYDPAADAWSPLTLRDGPAPREAHSATWTGAEIVVWGGANGLVTRSGGRWRP